MIAKTRPKTAGLIPAASYVRMSSDKQDRSPDRQRGILDKLAKREGCRIGAEFIDEGIHGDSGPEHRPGFGAMLEAAEQGEFQVLLLENGDRLGRFDSIDGGEHLSRLRRAGIKIITAADGVIDLDSFAGRVVHTIRQEGYHEYVVKLSERVVGSKQQNAQAGNWNGGPIPYAFQRAEVDSEGNVVRRLDARQPKSTTRGHRVRLVAVEDPARRAAVRYAFERFASADLSVRALAAELHDKGFPAPQSSGWNHATLGQILRNPIYCGGSRWNRSSGGKYHSITGGEITVTNGRGGPRRQNDQTDQIVQAGTHQGIVSAKLFARVQKRLAAGGQKRYARRAEYPLSGMIFCRHCGLSMHGTTEGKTGSYRYRRYICQTYRGDKHRNASGCGHYMVPAERVAKWLVNALQAEFGADGPGRAELVTEIKRQLRAGAKGSKQDTKRLTARLADLDLQVARLVKAIRTTDVPELAEELAIVRRDREAVQEALLHAGRYQAPQDVDREADATADELGRLVGSLDDGDPATVRQVFGLLVSKITCSWEQTTCRSGRQRCKLVEGEVELRNLGLQSVLCGGVAHVGA